MWTLARKEIRDALRHRWLQGYALVVAVVGVVAAYAAWNSSQGMSLASFGRTTATLTNFCLLLAPLVALTMGASAVASERDRGTLDFLLAQPLSRRDVLLGKYLGLSLSAVLATLAGFLPAWIAVAAMAGGGGILRFAVFPAIATTLVAAMLALGLCISVSSRSAVQAQGRAIFLWFAFVLLYDLLLMGTLLTADLGPGVLVSLLLLNPVDAARILAVLALEPDLHLLGPAGAFLMGMAGARGAALLLFVSLLAWTALPLLAALVMFRIPRARSRPAERENGETATASAIPSME
jgi:ABC-type transport system involved in multi-copper enzyme maturation permease subunit